MNRKMKQKLNYAQSGVNIDAGNNLVKKIIPFVKSTNRLGANTELGGFGGLFDLKSCGYQDPLLVAANDGVGTKLKIAIETNQHNTVGIDLVAMSVNDLIVQGAEPLFFLDYFACGHLNTETASIVIEGIAEGCKQANCALIGGETAEMPDMYHGEDYDLAGFAVGAVERNRLLPKKNLQSGDIILGIASSGVHSNGFSLIRKLIEQQNLSWQDECPFGQGTLSQNLLTPTRIYVKPILEVLRQTDTVKALCHITGGGFQENIPRILPKNLTAKVSLSSWSMPPVFSWLQEHAQLSTHELLKTFNCGVGMIIITDPKHATNITNILTQQGETVFSIGTLCPFDNESVLFEA